MISYGQMVVDGAAVDKAFEASVPGLAEEEDDLAEEIVEAASEAAAPVLTPAQPSPLEDLFGGATAQPTSSNQSDPFAAGIVSPPPVKRPARSLGLFA